MKIGPPQQPPFFELPPGRREQVAELDLRQPIPRPRRRQSRRRRHRRLGRRLLFFPRRLDRRRRRRPRHQDRGIPQPWHPCRLCRLRGFRPQHPQCRRQHCCLSRWRREHWRLPASAVRVICPAQQRRRLRRTKPDAPLRARTPWLARPRWPARQRREPERWLAATMRQPGRLAASMGRRGRPLASLEPERRLALRLGPQRWPPALAQPPVHGHWQVARLRQLASQAKNPFHWWPRFLLWPIAGLSRPAAGYSKAPRPPARPPLRPKPAAARRPGKAPSAAEARRWTCPGRGEPPLAGAPERQAAARRALRLPPGASWRRP